MKNQAVSLCWAVAILSGLPAISQSIALQGQGKAVVTIMPKKDGAVPPSVNGQDMSITVDGRQARVTGWKPYESPGDSIELVLLIDGGARGSLGGQYEYLTNFVKSLPPNIKAAIAYMQNGRAAFAGGLSADHAQVLRGLHLPGGSAGSSASPYFCLSDLAKHWPSSDKTVRREVVMVSDGVDPYNMEYNPDNPYLESAIDDSVRAGLVIYSLYWQSRGTGSSGSYENEAGQNYLVQVTQATGGKSYWMGMGNPVSFQPFLDELTRRFRNQYELSFSTGLTGKSKVEDFKLKFSAPGAEVESPGEVFVYPAAPMQK